MFTILILLLKNEQVNKIYLLKSCADVIIMMKKIIG